MVLALRRAYPSNEYAVVAQVANATGSNVSRWADAIAMGLWPSRGLHLHGFEMKSSRSDWKRELDQPEKAETIASKCNYWWIVAGADNIVQLDELPQPWGLYVCVAGELIKKKPAVFVERESTLPRSFVAAILRQAQEQCDVTAIASLVEETKLFAEYQRGLDVGEKRGLAQSDGAVAKLAELEKLVSGFEKAAGIDLHQFRWEDPAALGAAFRRVVRGEAKRDEERMLASAKSIVRMLEGAAK